MNIYNSFEEKTGNTPLVRLSKMESKYDISAAIYAKMESYNPAGSVKDRVAKSMLDDAEERGVLKPGGVIIEPTSGNTGIGLAAVGVSRGYRVVLVMPDSMSVERRKTLQAYGAELVLTEAKGGMKASIWKAKQLAEQVEGSFIPDQFNNPANPAVHERTTGPEIWNDMDGKVDLLVVGVGTGGTITGTGRYLKSKNPSLEVVAVEPAASPVLSKGVAGPHKIQGIGAGFVPGVLDTGIYNEVLKVLDEDAFLTGKELASGSGLLVGISSGAAVWAACRVGMRAENEGKNIVVILPDSGERYLSTGMFD